MRHVASRIIRLCRSETGQDLVEYGLLVMLITIAAVVAVGTVGNTVLTVFWNAIAAAPV